ncbi:YhcH/YjgK/YiaL family protein [Akkermansiaceae bacterium]|nr:YhcH/YjgK/YiaL family protein [Akkermansiaceae bacterium]
MIFDSLENRSRYYGINKYFIDAFNYVCTIDENIKNGEYRTAEGLVARVFEYQTLSYEDAQWESHQNVIDLQYCINGFERIHFAQCEQLTQVGNYDSDKDLFKYSTDRLFPYIDTGNQMFGVFFPEDAHAPQVFSQQASVVRKVVVKIPID